MKTISLILLIQCWDQEVQKAPRSDNKTSGGLGIGLSLVEDLVTFMNGTITVNSKLGTGSVFTLSLPIEPQNFEAYKKENEIEFNPSGGKEKLLKTYATHTPKILIVEDNKEMALYLNELLAPEFNCDTTHNGKQALAKVKERQYDLIVSDLRMPVMDGFEFKEVLNKIDSYENIPFLMISANTFYDTKVQGFTLGINDYITKPFNELELLARIKNLLRNKIVQNETINTFDENDVLFELNNKFNKNFLEKITAIVYDNLDDENFKVSKLVEKSGYGQRQLARMLKSITGMSPVMFILELRLTKAYELLMNQSCSNLNEVRFSVGLSSRSYFKRKFQERFGVKVGDFISDQPELLN